MTNGTANRIPLADLLVFHQLTRSLTSSFDLDTILRTILEHMERTIEAELWTLLMLDEPRQELYYALAAGGEQETLSGLRVKVGEGGAGWVAQHGESLIVPETVDDPRLGREQPGNPQRVRSVIAMPLRGRKGTHGVIQIFNPRADRMTDYTIALLHILADHAAIAIENAHDVARIQQLSITDDCTGLYNARHLYNTIESEVYRSTRFSYEFSVLFLDLDRFKLVNDNHGHLVGSRLLYEIGATIKSRLRLIDYAFRYGGDEFVVLLPQTSKQSSLVVARRLLEIMRTTKFHLGDNLDLNVRASMGVASFPDDAKNAHDLIRCADEMMYTVKNTTRDGIAVCGQERKL